MIPCGGGNANTTNYCFLNHQTKTECETGYAPTENGEMCIIGEWYCCWSMVLKVPKIEQHVVVEGKT